MPRDLPYSPVVLFQEMEANLEADLSIAHPFAYSKPKKSELGESCLWKEILDPKYFPPQDEVATSWVCSQASETEAAQ